LHAPEVAVINEEFARYFFGSPEKALGRHIGFGNPHSAKLSMTIIGVVKNSKSLDLKEKTRRFVYIPILQQEQPNSITYYLRTALDPRLTIQSIRQAIRRTDPALPVYGVKTLQVQVNETHYIERLVFFLSAAFGFLATTLAAFGLYGVTSYAVEQRTREIGIRIALGAQRHSVLRMVMSEVALLTVLGIAFAVPLAIAVGRKFQAQLFEVKGNDPVTLIASAVLLLAVGMIAGFVPAARASRVDPIQALRWD
jgi:ABC-type lipoprotein release transport system permease subunit